MPIWIHIGALLGRAPAAVKLFEREWACNRVDYDTASSLLTVRAHMAGSSAAIRADAREMRRSIGRHRWYDEYEFLAIVIEGKYDEAKTFLDASTAMPAADKRRFSLMLAALRKNNAEAANLRRAVAADPGFDLSRQMIVAAWFGERERAAEIAAKIDAAPLGHMGLLWATEYCFCGSPFPLEATPNFARQLREGDLPWPPKSPIGWPLKDW